MQGHNLCELRKQCIDGVKQFPEIKRLGKKNDLPLAHFFPRRSLSANQQSGSVFEVVKAMELVVQVQAIHVWQPVIEDEEMGRMDVNSLQGIAPGNVMMNVMWRFLLDGLNNDLSDVLLILDHENELDRLLLGDMQAVGFLWHGIRTFSTFRSPAKSGASAIVRAASKESFTLASWRTEVWYGA